MCCIRCFLFLAPNIVAKLGRASSSRHQEGSIHSRARGSSIYYMEVTGEIDTPHAFMIGMIGMLCGSVVSLTPQELVPRIWGHTTYLGLVWDFFCFSVEWVLRSILPIHRRTKTNKTNTCTRYQLVNGHARVTV